MQNKPEIIIDEEEEAKADLYKKYEYDEKEFNLSEKIKDGDWMYEGSNTSQKCYSEEDVKEFIKLLKEEIERMRRLNFDKDIQFDIDYVIDKLAGEKLI